ncbi:MAG: gamma-glutamyl-phosphate reductase, partial [Oscillospiraceae bacterium]|nr:gamma-glutamyl-phosphate reductase [Oscillospiraceae bacterium]
MTTTEILKLAKAASPSLMAAGETKRNSAINNMADMIVRDTEMILCANSMDLTAAEGILSPSMMDRLRLTPGRIAGMADAMRQVAKLPDPLGQVLEKGTRPNGLEISKVTVPLGLVSIIYEARPNVTSDAAVL